VGFIDVYRNGVLLGSADFTATNGTTVVLANPAASGDLIETISFLVSSVLNAIPNTAGSVSSANIANDVTINFADGSASTPSITNNGDTNTGIFFPAADTIAFSEGGAEIARFDSSGNLGIGTTSPTAKLGVTRSGNGYIQRWTNGTVITALYQDGSITSFGNDTNHDLILTANDSGVGRFTSAGLFQFNSGYGSVATAYGCRAWVLFNGTGTVSINGSGNVSSITDNGTGSYRVNFTTSMPNSNYAAAGQASNSSSFLTGQFGFLTRDTTGVDVFSASPTTGVAMDANRFDVVIFR
jgi:hypothetical protein